MIRTALYSSLCITKNVKATTFYSGLAVGPDGPPILRLRSRSFFGTNCETIKNCIVEEGLIKFLGAAAAVRLLMRRNDIAAHHAGDPGDEVLACDYPEGIR
ncbi:unnamed protein product [Toxocara canis]|uniref:Uncharacterized protein n=1 Tax=Toxocara canis TaxID=6265 RepID=A0A183TWR3_TOXCA|nr:unnamed protein product [Toxocara canis]